MACYRPVGGLTYWPCCHLGLKEWLHQSQVGCNQQHRHWYFGIREQKKKWFLPVKYPAEITVTRRIDYNLLLEKQHSTAQHTSMPTTDSLILLGRCFANTRIRTSNG